VKHVAYSVLRSASRGSAINLAEVNECGKSYSCTYVGVLE